MWERAFDQLSRHIIRRGDLRLEGPGGQVLRYGDGTGPQIGIRVREPAFFRRIVLNPDLALGEAYMDGDLVIEGDDLEGFLQLVLTNINAHGRIWWNRWLEQVRRQTVWLNRFNPVRQARANVAHHYDLSAELYRLFLDDDQQYSCAYFERPGMSLADAQAAKKALIARKLLIEPGMHVLDIGCGWGGLAITLARDHSARVTGVTLSTEQHQIATERVAKAGLSNRVDIRLMDYRAVTQRFDRIVSVGMFEHVGLPHYVQYFRKVRDCLAEDGVALIHTIGRTCPPAATSAWITKYIFPGGHVPSLSQVSGAVEDADLYPTDLEIWRLHYAETLRHWRNRFEAKWAQVAALYDERFCRMWRYYLLASEMTFRHNRQCVFQLQLARHQEAVPLTRDYLLAMPRELAAE